MYSERSASPQAVMLHVNVGLANSINALIDASRDRVPLLLTSGSTPITEEGQHGARSVYIHWAQEMFDQAGMLREFVKWDYEMRRGDQVAEVVDRALELAQASPTGPARSARRRPAQAARQARTAARRHGRHRTCGGMDRRRNASADHHRPARPQPKRGRAADTPSRALRPSRRAVQSAPFRHLRHRVSSSVRKPR